MKKLLFGILLLAASSAHATLSVVQSTGVWDNNQTTYTLKFNVSPSTGDLLVVEAGYGLVNTPAGWTLIGSTTNVISLSLYDHVVGSAEANSYTFTLTGGANYSFGIGYEVTGQSSSVAIDTFSLNAFATTPLTMTSTATPSVIGDLGLSFSTQYIWSSGTTCSSGWTVNVSTGQNNFYAGGDACSKNALTTDVVTPISNTFQNTSASQWVDSGILFVEPAPAVTNNTPLFKLNGSMTVNGGIVTIQ